jgi:hypothetical protein
VPYSPDENLRRGRGKCQINVKALCLLCARSSASPGDRWSPADRGLAFFQSIAAGKRRNSPEFRTPGQAAQSSRSTSRLIICGASRRRRTFWERNASRSRRARTCCLLEGNQLALATERGLNTAGGLGTSFRLPYRNRDPRRPHLAKRFRIYCRAQSGEGGHVGADLESCWRDRGRCCALHIGSIPQCAQ